MAYVFNKKCQVEYNFKIHLPKGKKQMLLFPFYSYGVLAPKPVNANNGVNIFQRAILNMCKSGVREAKEISMILDLHVNLTAYILKELMDKCYVNVTDASLTEEGEKILEGDIGNNQDYDREHYVVGRIYQDPWTLEIYPRFDYDRTMDTVEIKSIKGDKYPRLVLGTKGNPVLERPHWIVPEMFSENIREPVRPEPEQILEVIIRHSRALKSMQSNDENIVLQNNIPEMRRIDVVDDMPDTVFVATYLCKRVNVSLNLDWTVLDPFGIDAASMRVHRQIEKIMGPKDYLGKFVYGDKTIDGLSISKSKIKIESKAKEEVLFRLSSAIEESFLFYSLISCEENYQEYIQGKKERQRDSVYSSIAKTYELLFLKIREDYISDYEKIDQMIIPRDVGINYETLKSIVKQISPNVEVPKILGTIRGGKIYWEVKTGGQSLMPKMVAGILAIDRNPKHILAEMLKSDPELLGKISSLSALRDSTAHVGLSGWEEIKANALSVVAEAREDLYKVVEVYECLNKTQKE
jgi:hypothetical protein